MAYKNLLDMFDGGGMGRSGDTFQGGGILSEIANMPLFYINNGHA